MRGEYVSVVGTVNGFAHGYLHLDIPLGQLPPPGSCKLWDPAKEPGQQPPPESCEVLIETAPSDRVVIDHDGQILLDRRGLMLVDAIAVEHGSFIQVDGDVDTIVVVDEFTMNISPGEPVVSDVSFPVRLQDAPAGGNGTRIISKTGELLAADEIDEEENITVDAVLIYDAIDDAYLRSSIIVLDNSGTSVQRLTGTVTNAVTGNVIVTAPTGEDNPCSNTAGDVTVAVDVETSFLTLIITDTSSDTEMGGELNENQRVDVYGSCELSGIFHADQIIITDDLRS